MVNPEIIALFLFIVKGLCRAKKKEINYRQMGQMFHIFHFGNNCSS